MRIWWVMNAPKVWWTFIVIVCVASYLMGGWDNLGLAVLGTVIGYGFAVLAERV